MTTLNEWQKGLPKEVGNYWLYSYRYGKSTRLDVVNEPELLLATVFEVTNGVMLVADGQIVQMDEIECPYFKVAILPELPNGY